MPERITHWLLLFAAGLLLSGCTSADMNQTAHDNGSGNSATVCHGAQANPATCQETDAGDGNSSPENHKNVGSSFPACYDPNRFTSKTVAEHHCTWPAFALKRQRRLDRAKPLGQNLILSTHNSFNVKGWAGSYSKLDPNQLYGLKDQLRLSMRGLELDVHWIRRPGAGHDFRPVLCHGTSNHIPCTGSEPLLKAGLRKIRDWLKAHPDQFILLDIQAEFDGKAEAFESAGQVLKKVLGDLIYRPVNGNCASMPLDVSPANILATGAQVLVTGDCGPSGTVWRSLVHSTNIRVQRNNLITDKFSPYPDCDSDHFSKRDYARHWVRLWEDTTRVAALTGATGEIKGEDLRRMIRCGVNQPSLDKLTPQDPRFRYMVWSWATGEPTQSKTLNCAVHNAQGRFVAANCDRVLPYACYSADTKSWIITKQGGPWHNGAKICSRESNGSSAFAVPFNGRNNEKLKAVKKAGNYTRVWLNYTDRDRADGYWVANALSTP